MHARTPVLVAVALGAAWGVWWAAGVLVDRAVLRILAGNSR